MNIEIYTELDSLWDTRRMILSHLAEETKPNFDWLRNFSNIYRQRKYDYFDYPEFGFSKERYLERYKARTKADWVKPNRTYAIPSQLVDAMFRIVRELEFGIGKMLSDARFNLTVNTWPYQLNAQEEEVLGQVIYGAIPFRINLRFIQQPEEKQTTAFFHFYQYVFKYDILLASGPRVYSDNIGNHPTTNTRFVVPLIFAKQIDLVEGLKNETPEKLIMNINLGLGGKVSFIGVDKAIYDYKPL